ncbi:MAG: CDP-glycerol glycerophosphotransferase family protein [Eubacteriales bacterium]|nr:CDP-glycerol glycerophosphotransferase family protein [Eubacteriales bacterium]
MPIFKSNSLNRIFFSFRSVLHKPIFYFYRKYCEKFCAVKTDKILFYPNVSTTDSDNALVLYQYLQKKQAAGMMKYSYVILLKRDDFLPEGINRENTKIVRWNSDCYQGMPIETVREISTSHYIFFTNGSPIKRIKKKKEQIVVNLWHGSGYKDIQNPKDRWICGKHFDYVLVPGEAFIVSKAKFFDCKKEQIWPIGYPRYDLLKSNNMQKMNEFATYYRLLGMRTIVWMPTFRKTDSNAYCPESEIQSDFDLPLLKNVKELDVVNDFCNHYNIKIIIKRHPFQSEYICERQEYSNIIFLSNEDLRKQNISVYSFLTMTDALISDYSSVAIDYLLLNKPIAFALDDFDEYKSTRGFVFEDPLKYMPGHHLYCLNDLRVFLSDIANGVDRYAKERKAIMPEVHSPCNNYCECVWGKVSNIYIGSNL